MKALKEKRGAGRPGAPTTTSSAPPERPSPKKPRPRRGKPGMDAAVAEPRAQLRTYLTDGLLDAGEPPEPPHGTQGTRRVPGGSQQHPKEGSRGGAPPAADGGGAVAGWEPLSLAERVERNRRLLQEVLGLAAAGSAHGACRGCGRDRNLLDASVEAVGGRGAGFEQAGAHVPGPNAGIGARGGKLP